MAQRELYTVAQAAQMLNLSKAALRAYASKEVYRRYLSTEATPDPGRERRFTVDDLKLFAFIANRTRLGESHDTVAQDLGAGRLAEFEWTPTEPTISVEGSESQQAALVPLEQLRALQAILADTRQRESETKEESQAQIQQAKQENEKLQEEIRRLERELGAKQGELSAHKEMRRKPPRWWVALFGE